MKNKIAFILLSSIVGSQAAERPNVILIYADDLGKGMLSAYGQRYISTPNIDKIIADGISFENAYGCMLSAPSRASLLTGYHDCHTDKWRISEGGQFAILDTSVIAARENIINSKDILLPAEDLYLPQVFSRAGYVTGEIGKLEWGFTATRKQMHLHGWDYFYGYLDHVRCHGFYPPFLFNNDSIEIIEGNTMENCGKTLEPETKEAYSGRWDFTGKKQYSQDIFISKIKQFISDNKERPFFLYHPTQLPHGPVQVKEIHPDIAGFEELTSIEKEYATMVKMLDDNVGEIVKELEKLGILEKTIIIFASDNGHEIYYAQKGRVEKPYRNMVNGELFDDYKNKYYSDLAGDIFNGNASMAGLKRSNLDGGVHIPLALYQKGIYDKGIVINELVSMYDLLETFAQMNNIELKSKKDGVSLTGVLNGDKLPKERYVIYSSFIGGTIITNEGWKLRHYAPENIYELYNLKKDSQEKKNVAEENIEITNKLKSILISECGGNIYNGVAK